MTSTTIDKKVAAQFSKIAKLQLLTTMLRDECGSKITRKELKAFEKRHGVVVQWVARREDPVQKFRTPLGFVRPDGARGWYQIPDAPADGAGLGVETVTAPKVLPDPPLPADDPDAPLSADEQAVGSMLGLEDPDGKVNADGTVSVAAGAHGLTRV
jgi:hypothetical protein